jgi:hypothetical protein
MHDNTFTESSTLTVRQMILLMEQKLEIYVMSVCIRLC